MKIIGDMGSSKKLVEIDDNEIAIIMGCRSAYDKDFDKRNLQVGSILDVVRFYKTSEFIRSVNTSNLQSSAGNLSAAVKEIEKAISLIDEINVFQKLKEES